MSHVCAPTSAPLGGYRCLLRASWPGWRLMSAPVLVFDNGGGSLKAGWSTDAEPIVMHNFTARSKSDKKIYVADEVC